MLAGLVLREQGIDVKWISFVTPFFSAAKARKASKLTGIPLIVKNITPVYLDMLLKPPAGYGQHMNPCMDCHTLMFRLAGELMKRRGFDFLFSGEVLGQRPMSQTRPSLRYVEKHSGYDGYILRPLSAKRLPLTIPEKSGWVDRDRLYDFAGRSRKPQIRLAARFGIESFPTPAGGCLLTDKGYTRRLKDLFQHRDPYSENDLHLLKYGRHFRLMDGTKIIVGRTRHDNERIQHHFDPARDTMIRLSRLPGPTVVLPGGGTPDGIETACGLCVGYSKADGQPPVPVEVTTPSGSVIRHAKNISPSQLRPYMI